LEREGKNFKIQEKVKLFEKNEPTFSNIATSDQN